LVEWYWQGREDVLGENLSLATLLSTNPTRIVLGLNSSFRDERLATDSLLLGISVLY
jgi:hypothetical protein